MTIAEFNNTRWGCGMYAKYRGEEYPIVSCDFDEALVALRGVVLGANEPLWVRCENIEIVRGDNGFRAEAYTQASRKD